MPRKIIPICPLSDGEKLRLQLVAPKIHEAFSSLEVIKYYGSPINQIKAGIALYSVHHLIKKEIFSSHKMPKCPKNEKPFLNLYAELSYLLLKIIDNRLIREKLNIDPIALWALVLGEGEIFSSRSVKITKTDVIEQSQKANKQLMTGAKNPFESSLTKELFDLILSISLQSDIFAKKYFNPFIRKRMAIMTAIKETSLHLIFEVKGQSFMTPAGSKKRAIPLENSKVKKMYQ